MRWDDIYKHELADKLAPQISKEGLTDVTDWIEKNAEIKNGEDFRHNGVARSVSYILESKGDFKVEKLPDESRFYVKRLPKRSLEQRHPTLFKLGLIFLGAVLTILGSLTKNKESHPVYKLDTTRSDGLYDSISTIRKELRIVQDTLEKYKRR